MQNMANRLNNIHLISRTTDSTWRKHFAEIVSFEKLNKSVEQFDLTMPIPSCARGDCSVCVCASASITNSVAYITGDYLSEEYAGKLVNAYMLLYPLFPIVPVDELQQCISELVRDCSKDPVNISGMVVYALPSTTRNMIALFIMTIGLLNCQREPLPLLICQIPGCNFFAAAMFMMQQLSAADQGSLAVLQGNLAYIAVSTCLSRFKNIKEALELLCSAQSTYFQALQAGSNFKIVDWQAWLHYSVSALESQFLDVRETSKFIWPSMEACVQVIEAHPVAGYALCSMKDLEKCQTDLGHPANHVCLQLNEVSKNVDMLFVVRENMPEELRWSDDDSPSDNVLHVIVRYKFYFTLVCTLFDVFKYFAKPELEKNQLNKGEYARAIRLLKTGVEGAKRLMDIDRDLCQPFPLKYAHTQCKAPNMEFDRGDVLLGAREP